MYSYGIESEREVNKRGEKRYRQNLRGEERTDGI